HLTAAQYQKTLDLYSRKGYRPLWASAYKLRRSARFNVVLVQEPGKEWHARHDLTSADLQKESDRLARQGHDLCCLSGYNLAGDSSSLAVGPRALPLPVSGTAVPDLAPFDRAMLTYMKERGVRAGALAVMKDGRLLLQRGYGWSTRDGSRTVQPDD